MHSKRVKYLLFILIDGYFAVTFFSVKAALILPYIISPLVFILFLAFFQNPHSFMRQWNSWLVQIVKFAFLGIGAYIFFKVGYFPELNDFLIVNSINSFMHEIGDVEGVLFVILAAISQIGLIISIIFNLLALLFPKKFGEGTDDYTLSFFKSLIPTIICTLVFTIGLLLLTAVLN